MTKRLLGIAALSLLLSACGSKDATAKLKFTKTARMFDVASTVLPGDLRANAPTTFKMKFIAAYLAEDIAEGTGNNVGMTSMFYLNPECADDISHCDISAGTAEDGTPMSKIITTFFDFTSDTAANTAINSQGRTITAGSYKYVRLEFCKYASGTDPNIQWADTANSVSTVQEFKQTSCTVNSAEITPPITIAAGGSATVNLTYDLSSTVTSGGSGANCSSNNFCFQLPTFVPSATVR